MSRKDYAAVAAVLRDALDTIREDEELGVADDIEPDAVVMTVAYGLSDVFAADNPHFDRERFIAAALEPQQ